MQAIAVLQSVLKLIFKLTNLNHNNRNHIYAALS